MTCQLRPALRTTFRRVAVAGAIAGAFGLVACGNRPVRPIGRQRYGVDLHHQRGHAAAAGRHVSRRQPGVAGDQRDPEDRSSWGAFTQLRDEAITQLKAVIDEAEAAGPKGTPEQRKIAALYASFMDEQRLEGLGGKPIAQVRVIDGIRSKRELPAVIAQMNEVNIVAPISVDIGQDARDPTRYIPTIFQGGLGLPDRDDYLKDDDAKLKDTPASTSRTSRKMLALAGVPNAERGPPRCSNSRRSSRARSGRASRTAIR